MRFLPPGTTSSQHSYAVQLPTNLSRRNALGCRRQRLNIPEWFCDAGQFYWFVENSKPGAMWRVK